MNTRFLIIFYSVIFLYCIFFNVVFNTTVMLVMFIVNILCLLSFKGGILNKLKLENQKQKEMFSENIIHDLKVPLIAQIRGIELIKALPATENNLKNEILSEVYNSSSQSLKLISDLAYSCSLEYSPRTNKECLIVQEIINQVVDEITPIAVSKNISFCFHKSDNSILFMDRRHMRNILLNIIYNAILYSHNNEKININHTVENGAVNINIVSHGFILTDEEYKNITDKNSDFRQYSAVGQGISLHLSKQILELNKGKLLFSSDGVSKNKFEIILPALTMSNCKVCK